MASRVALVGDGVTGDRIAKRLNIVAHGCQVIQVDPRGDMSAARDADVAILVHGGRQIRSATRLVEMGVPMVSVTDRVADVQALLELDDTARLQGIPLVVGAGMSPGLTGLLARHLVGQLESCDEIHIAMHGTAGPACARQHHRALAGHAHGLHDSEPIVKPAGSGRELCWFPEPVGAYDCYRAELPAPMLLHQNFPEVRRISARVSANRRDRLTARLPMLSPPHSEGGVGAVRVEVRGRAATGERITLIAGVAELVATSAAATATAFAGAVLDGLLHPGVVASGAPELDTLGLLHTIERLGVRLQEFTGIPHFSPEKRPHA
jgi:diadenosine tetraphosphatase ApaH/serine/threonine PP2A family protein phosphatase